jgi:hypothetical protein
MNAAEVAAALGAAYRSGEWWRCRCPSHGSDSAALALRDGARGLIVKCHRDCTPADILDALRHRGLYSASAEDQKPALDPEREWRRAEAEAAERRRKIALARDMWREGRPAAGTIAERYLRDRLPGLGAIPPTIRYLPPGSPYARHREGTGCPVMLAAVQHIGEAGIVAAHRTWLGLDGGGRKAAFRDPRLSLGPIGGGAVRLAAAAETLIVAEGIETTLAAMIACNGLPGWAALSAGGIARLILPPVVRTVIIAADHDANGTGERAARNAAARWEAEGRQVKIYMSPRVGEDAADLLAAAAREARHAA